MTSVRRVARILSRQPAPPVRLRQGIVDTINSDRTVDLTIGGSAVVVEGVPCLTSAVPRTGSAVMVVQSGRDMFVLGSVADDTAHAFTPLIQFGTVSLSLSSAAFGNDTVTYDWAFPSSPKVLVSCNRGSVSNKIYIPVATDVTDSDFVARARSYDDSSNTEDVNVRWIAVHAG